MFVLIAFIRFILLTCAGQGIFGKAALNNNIVGKKLLGTDTRLSNQQFKKKSFKIWDKSFKIFLKIYN